MKLNEIKVSLLDKKTIGDKIRKYGLNPTQKITINSDGTVDVETDVWIESLNRFDEITQTKTGFSRKIQNFDEFDVQFGTVTKSFTISDCSNLISLKGCPTRVEGSFKLSKCPGIKSLEHAPAWIGGDCTLSNNGPGITDFGSIKYVGGKLIFFDTSIVNVLKVFKIRGVKSIHCGSSTIDDIVNKYIPTRDVIGCQDEMIEAGWEGYTR